MRCTIEWDVVTEIGTSIRDILLTERLGEGGMGEVFVGIHHTLGREVAVKVLRTDRQMNASAKARFLREARILSALEHQNICRLYDLIEEEGHHYIVLELLRGKTLRQLLKPGSSSPDQTKADASASDDVLESDIGDEQRMQIAEQVAAALVAAHALSIVHRDLKPENIMLGDDGVVKVLDFGIARRAEIDDEPNGNDDQPPDPSAPLPHQNVTLLGDVLGTPHYLSPEQARGEVVTAASDMYCYGLLLAELWTGRSPYGTDCGATQLVRKAEWGELDPIEGIKPGIATLIADLTRLSPGERPTASEAAERLRWIVEEPRRKSKRRMVIAIMAALAIAAGASGIGYVSARRSQERAEAAQAEAEAVNTFLRNMLGSAAPVKKGIDVKVIDILDDAADTIRHDFKGSPGTAASVQFTLGETYRALGQREKARICLNDARNLFLKVDGQDSRRALLCNNSLAIILMQDGQLDEAETLLRSTREAGIRTLGPNDSDVARLTSNLGICLRRLGRYDEAEPLYKESLNWKRLNLGETNPRTLLAAANLANLKTVQGKLDEAEPMYRDLLVVFRRTLGDEHPETLTLTSSFASFLIGERGSYEEGLALYDQVLEGRIKILGPEHPETLSSFSKKARILRKIGRLTEAENLLRDLLKTQERLLGQDHSDSLETLHGLANVLAKEQRFSEAKPMFRHLLDLYTQRLGPDHPKTLAVMGSLTNTLVASGEYDEAVILARQLLRGMRKVHGENHRRTLSAMGTLSEALIAVGQVEEASQLAEETLAKKRESLGPEHPNTINARAIYAITLQRRGRFQEAEREFRDVLEIRNRVNGPDHYRTAEARADLAGLLREIGRDNEAEALKVH